jgi:acyl carrier protein
VTQPTEEDIRDFVRLQITEIKGLDRLELDDDALLFEEVGATQNVVLDSLDALELGLAIEERYEIEIPDDVDVKSFATVNSIVSYVAASLRSDP